MSDFIIMGMIFFVSGILVSFLTYCFCLGLKGDLIDDEIITGDGVRAVIRENMAFRNVDMNNGATIIVHSGEGNEDDDFVFDVARVGDLLSK